MHRGELHLSAEAAVMSYTYCCCGYVLHPVVVRCDMVLHQAFRARLVRKTGIGGEVRHGLNSGVLCETCLNKHVTPHLHREYEVILQNRDGNGGLRLTWRK